MSEDLAALSRTLGDRYLLEHELGRGGMGTVYLARDRRLDRPVALKVLPPEFASVPELRERFLRETRLAAGFSHPNIVPVFAIEETDDVLAFAMGFVEGEALSARVAREGPLSQRDAVRLMTDVGYALAYAHGRGVVHRDIKPDNIMIERATGRALVMDFGIARAITPVADKPGLTRIGEVVGTPEYMSPEQAAGEAVDGRADLYSLGLVAWFALAGRTAVTGESTQRILVKQLTEVIPPLAGVRTDLPPALSGAVDRCCAKEADDRFPNAEALVEALDAAQLSTPEIPVAIRLLAPELSSSTARAVISVGVLAFGTASLVATQNGNTFAIGVVIAATAVAGTVAALREAGHLRRSGYSIAELQRLLRVTLTERDEERARRATDTVEVRKRRRRVLLAGALLVLQAALLAALFSKAGRDGNIHLKGTPSTLAFFASVLGTTMAIAILSTSPFKRTLTERLFNAVWLGRAGAWLLARFSRGSGKVHIDAPAPVRRTAPTPAASRQAGAQLPSLDGLAADVSALAARVSALESRQR
ncbi:MAG: serine/threonine protein kinase [Gemmatimonadaceae bacterium]|nr:serine/threonine protein kinase [Gemmatimonadaceae bacterium]